MKALGFILSLVPLALAASEPAPAARPAPRATLAPPGAPLLFAVKTNSIMKSAPLGPSATPGTNRLFAFKARPDGQLLLAPGVYETAPYTCIVVVPGPSPDDKALVSPGAGTAYRMPIGKPELRFIPRAPPTK